MRIVSITHHDKKRDAVDVIAFARENGAMSFEDGRELFWLMLEGRPITASPFTEKDLHGKTLHQLFEEELAQ
jgi:hypothetical protein